MTTCAHCGGSGEAYAPCPRCGELIEPTAALDLDAAATSQAWDAGTADAPTDAQIGGDRGAAPLAPTGLAPRLPTVSREVLADAERAIARDDERRRKLWWRAVHVPVWGLLAFFTASYLTLDGMWMVTDRANDALHIGGHAVFNWGGAAQRALGGTVGQILVPAGLAVYMLWGRADRFWAAAATWWVGNNVVHIAAYMRDAEPALREPLAGNVHAWQFLMNRWGATERAASIAGTVDTVGIVVMALSIAVLAFLAWFPDRQELLA